MNKSMDQARIIKVNLLTPDQILVDFSNETSAVVSTERLKQLILEDPESISRSDEAD